MPMYAGSTPTTAQARKTPMGVAGCASAAAPDASTIAAPPSTIPLALPAVTPPSFLNTGGSFARVSMVVSGRM